MHRQLVEAAGPENLADAVAKIVNWGSLPPLSPEAVERVLGSLPVLDQLAITDEPPAALYADRIPAVSKVYAMYELSRWVIYDSRVARGLALLVSEAVGSGSLPSALVFPQPRGRTGLRPNGFPMLGTEKQARLGFIYASWFAQDLADQIDLPCPNPAGWDVRHVEMVLFMLGRPTDGISHVGTSVSADQIVTTIDRRLRVLRGDIAKLEGAYAALVGQPP
jgi:hypothetical protein